MTEPWCSGISPVQADRIKRAVESTCELCREYMPTTHLMLHGFPPKGGARLPGPKEREQHILVVCEHCHNLIHAEPVPEKKLRALIARRPFGIRHEILLALGYIPKPVIPPDNQDFARVYDDTIKDFSGHYR